MSTDMFPYVTAYLVGGPADVQEYEVSSAMACLVVPAAVRSEPWTWTEDPMSPPPFRTEAHSYNKPCPETGEWLWQGAR